MEGVVDGQVVDEGYDREEIQTNYINGDFIDSKEYDLIYLEAYNLGKQSAKTIYTKEGRKKTETIINKIKKDLTKGSLLPVIRKGQILWRIENETCEDLDVDDRKHLNLLNRALRYSRAKETSLIRDSLAFEHSKIKLSAQSNGFSRAFDEVKFESEYRNEDDRIKPWYLQSDIHSKPFIKI